MRACKSTLVLSLCLLASCTMDTGGPDDDIADELMADAPELSEEFYSMYPSLMTPSGGGCYSQPVFVPANIPVAAWVSPASGASGDPFIILRYPSSGIACSASATGITDSCYASTGFTQNGVWNVNVCGTFANVNLHVQW